MLSQAELIDNFYDELGGVDSPLAQLVDTTDVVRWLNDGQRRLGWYVRKTAALTWASTDTSVDLPADFFDLAKVRPDVVTSIPAFDVWGTKLLFTNPDGAPTSGNATLLYLARPAAITDTQDSELTDEGDTGIVAFALYRLFKKLSNSRAEYKRYSTLVGANGVSMEDLQDKALAWYDEFVSSGDSLPPDPPAFFFDRTS